MALEIIRNNITKVKADAIVNTANPYVAIGEGVDEAIYNAAGKEELLKEREKIGKLAQGEVAYTKAFDLPAKYILHTVGPIWRDGNHREVEVLRKCYQNALNLALSLDCQSIAFPLIASGTYRFPKEIALSTAMNEISDFLFHHDMQVYLVVYDKESFEVSSKVFKEITNYIEENEEIELDYEFAGDIRNENVSYSLMAGGSKKEAKKIDAEDALEDILAKKEETFQEHLFYLIDHKGLDEVEVYKKANLDRKHFSKIRSNANYQPTKRTALALAIALELNLDETKDLLLKAGIALSHSSVFDLIMEYCITHEIHDIYEVNCILFKFDQPTLGA